MKNIITILLILIFPVISYVLISKNSSQTVAVATNNNLPTVLVFSSSMCLDCQKLKLVIDDVSDNYSDKINIVKVNIDNSKKVNDYIKKYGIQLVPTTVFLDENGNKINKIEGFIEKDEFIKNLEGVING